MTAVTSTFPNYADNAIVTVSLHNVCCQCGAETDTRQEIPAWCAKMLKTETQHLCPGCADAKKAESNARNSAARISEALRCSGIEAEFLGTWDSEIGNRDLANAMRANADKHLFVVGEHGSGKTRCVCVNLERIIRQGKRGKCYRFNKLANDYSKTFAQGEIAPDAFIDQLLRCDVLVIDDICKKERIRNTAAEFAYEMMDKIYASNTACRVWFTSNTVPAELNKKFDSKDIAAAVSSRIDRLHDAGKLKLIKADGKVL